jgi:YggT family protein
MPFILILLQSLIVTAWLVVLVRVLMSWIDPQFQKPISRFVYGLTEPVLTPLRNVLPKAGRLDLAPLVLLLGLGFAMRVLLAT